MSLRKFRNTPLLTAQEVHAVQFRVIGDLEDGMDHSQMSGLLCRVAVREFDHRDTRVTEL